MVPSGLCVTHHYPAAKCSSCFPKERFITVRTGDLLVYHTAFLVVLDLVLRIHKEDLSNILGVVTALQNISDGRNLGKSYQYPQSQLQ